MFTSTALGQSAAPELRGQRTLPALSALTGPWGEHCKSDRHFCSLGDGRLVGWSLLEIQIRRGETSRVATVSCGPLEQTALLMDIPSLAETLTEAKSLRAFLCRLSILMRP